MADNKGTALAVSPPSPPTHLIPLLEVFKRLYASNDYADVTIICQGREFKAQKFCLCAQSEVLQNTLGGNFKEAKESKITADEDSPQIMEGFIHYFYNFDYGECTNKLVDISPIVLDVRMHAIADKYFVEPLKKLAAAKFEARAREDWHTSAFADAVAEIYQTTSRDDEPIREIALQTIRTHSHKLLRKDGRHVAFLAVLRETAELGADLATSLESKTSMVKYECPKCSTILEVGGLLNCDIDTLRRSRGCFIGVMPFWQQYQVRD